MKKAGPIKGRGVEAERLKGKRDDYLDEKRREIVDGRPLEPPVGYKRSPTLAEQIKAMVHGETLARAARESGAETFEEADDFDVEDDFDPRSPYEEYFDPREAYDERNDALAAAVQRGMTAYNEAIKKQEGAKKKKEGGSAQSAEPPSSDESSGGDVRD